MAALLARLHSVRLIDLYWHDRGAFVRVAEIVTRVAEEQSKVARIICAHIIHGGGETFVREVRKPSDDRVVDLPAGWNRPSQKALGSFPDVQAVADFVGKCDGVRLVSASVQMIDVVMQQRNKAE